MGAHPRHGSTWTTDNRHQSKKKFTDYLFSFINCLYKEVEKKVRDKEPGSRIQKEQKRGGEK
jgi:hypothetical protein